MNKEKQESEVNDDLIYRYDFEEIFPNKDGTFPTITDDELKRILLHLINSKLPKKHNYVYVMFPLTLIFAIISIILLIIYSPLVFLSSIMAFIAIFVTAILSFFKIHRKNEQRRLVKKIISSFIDDKKYQDLYDWLKTKDNYRPCLLALCYYKAYDIEEDKRFVIERRNSIYEDN